MNAKSIALWALVATIAACLVTLLSSQAPDGLEAAATQLGIGSNEIGEAPSNPWLRGAMIALAALLAGSLTMRIGRIKKYQ